MNRLAVGMFALAAFGCSGDDPNGVVGPTLDAAACPAKKLLFVNGFETTYFPGETNAVARRSSTISEETTLAASPLSDDVWNDMMASVRAKFAPYNVDVVDELPTSSEPRFEVMVTGDGPDSIGFDTYTGWSLAPKNCQVLHGTSFVFVPNLVADVGEDPDALADTVAKSVANMMGPPIT